MYDDLLGKLWPAFLRPQPDELLSSWLVRLARAHNQKIHTFCSVTWPKVQIWNRDVDRLAPTTLLNTLTIRTPTLPGRVWETTLASYSGWLYACANPRGNTEWILPLGIYHRTRSRFGLLFCPQCLQNDGTTPYFRRKWRLALALVCPQCEIYLQDRCPQCSQPIVFFRQELGRKSALPDAPITSCFHCRFDIRSAVGQRAPIALVQRQKEWYRILSEGWHERVFYPHLYFSVLRQVAKTLFSPRLFGSDWQQDVSHQSGIYLPTEVWRARPEYVALEFWPLAVRTAILQQAQWLLEDWPRRFIAIMKQYHIASTPLLRDKKNLPYWYESVIRDHLYINNINRRFDGFWK